MANTKKITDKQLVEIRQAMQGLTGSDAKQEAVRLADIYECSHQHIYKITADLRKGTRKTRADKGKRLWKLEKESDVWKAAQFVIHDNLDPALALLTAKERGFDNLPGLATFQNLLREHQLNRKNLKKKKRPHVRFEAEYPGEMFQVDVTGLKVRWADLKTRAILKLEGIDKNHPNLDENKVRVWQIMLVDDHSRRHFLRYVQTRHIQSKDIILFLCEAFEELGVCKTIYIDNGGEFKGMMNTAEMILNTILKNDGGFELLRHLPRNAQASGKVENAHLWAEKMDKLVGVAINEGQEVKIEHLNSFASEICKFFNESRVHRSTGQKPIDRWFGKRSLIRRLPTEILRSALLSKEYIVPLRSDLTIEIESNTYQIPRKRPFTGYLTDNTNEKVRVIMCDEYDVFLLFLPGEDQPHEIEKEIAAPIRAGEFEAYEESAHEQLKKELVKTRKEDIREIKKTRKQTGEIAPVPFFNTPARVEKDNTIHFPHKERIVTPDEIAEAIPNRVPSRVFEGKQINYWESIGMFAEKFETAAEAREFLRSVFADDEVLMTSIEVEEIIDNRTLDSHETKLRIVS